MDELFEALRKKGEIALGGIQEIKEDKGKR